MPTAVVRGDDDGVVCSVEEGVFPLQKYKSGQALKWIEASTSSQAHEGGGSSSHAPQWWIQHMDVWCRAEGV